MDKEPLTDSNTSVKISFIVAISAITITSIVAIIFICLYSPDITTATVLIGSVTSFVITICATIVGLAKLLFQLKGEMNHRFTELMEINKKISYNAGVDAGLLGETQKHK
jgi:hypothetical protein